MRPDTGTSAAKLLVLLARSINGRQLPLRIGAFLKLRVVPTVFQAQLLLPIEDFLGVRVVEPNAPRLGVLLRFNAFLGVAQISS